jgi:hypothetical protein
MTIGLVVDISNIEVPYFVTIWTFGRYINLVS